jgi:hypothetical protein
MRIVIFLDFAVSPRMSHVPIVSIFLVVFRAIFHVVVDRT